MSFAKLRRFGRQLISNAVEFFNKQTVASLLFLLLAGVLVAALNMVSLSSELINTQALQSSFLYANALQNARTYYSETVVKKLKNQDFVKIDHDHIGKLDTVPIPATFLIDLGERISKENLGVLGETLQ